MFLIMSLKLLSHYDDDGSSTCIHISSSYLFSLSSVISLSLSLSHLLLLFCIIIDRVHGSRVVLMTSSQSGTDTHLTFIESQSQSQPHQPAPIPAEPLKRTTSYRIPGCLSRFVTEFILTDDWYIVLTSPLSLNLERLATLYMVSQEVLPYHDYISSPL